MNENDETKASCRAFIFYSFGFKWTGLLSSFRNEFTTFSVYLDILHNSYVKLVSLHHTQTSQHKHQRIVFPTKSFICKVKPNIFSKWSFARWLWSLSVYVFNEFPHLFFAMLNIFMSTFILIVRLIACKTTTLKIFAQSFGFHLILIRVQMKYGAKVEPNYGLIIIVECKKPVWTGEKIFTWNLIISSRCLCNRKSLQLYDFFWPFQ